MLGATRYPANCGLSISFWLIETRGLATMYGILAGLMSGVTLPVAFFPEWARLVMWCTPFPAMLQGPVDVFTEHPHAWYAVGHQLFFAVALLWLGRVLLRRAERKLVIQGG